MKEFLGACGVQHSRTGLHNPQANGIEEKANRLVKGAIQLALTNGLSVDKTGSYLVWAYCTMENASQSLAICFDAG